MAKKKATTAAKTATKKATKKRRPRERQAFIKGTEPPSIPEIDKAARSYVEARDERMDLTETEVERKAALTELMKKHELEEYEFDGMVVTRKPGKDSVKVRVKKEEGADED